MPKKTKIKVKKQKIPTKNKIKNIQNVKVNVSTSGGSGGTGGTSLRPQPNIIQQPQQQPYIIQPQQQQPYIIQQPQQPYIIQQPSFTPTNIRNEIQQPQKEETTFNNITKSIETQIEPQQKQNINWANVPIFDPFEDDYNAVIEPDIIQSNNKDDDFLIAFKNPLNNDNKTLLQKTEPSAPQEPLKSSVQQNILFKPINNNNNKTLLQKISPIQEMGQNPLFIKQLNQNNAEQIIRDKDIELNEEGPGGGGAGGGGAGPASKKITIFPDTYISQAQSGSFVFTPPKGFKIDGQNKKTYKMRDDAYRAREQFFKDNNIKYEIK